MTTPRDAVLVLEDGRTFRGEAYGAVGETVGEAVFSTGMTGYQETLSDPSYYGQVVVMTAPHVGNTGVNDEDGGVVADLGAGLRRAGPRSGRRAAGARARPRRRANKQGVVGISGIDTRALTRHLRERGAMRVGISSTEPDARGLLERVRSAPSMTGAALADKVSTQSRMSYRRKGEQRCRASPHSTSASRP